MRSEKLIRPWCISCLGTDISPNKSKKYNDITYSRFCTCKNISVRKAGPYGWVTSVKY